MDSIFTAPGALLARLRLRRPEPLEGAQSRA